MRIDCAWVAWITLPLLSACGGVVASSASTPDHSPSPEAAPPASPDAAPPTSPLDAFTGEWGESDTYAHAQMTATPNGVSYYFDCMQGSSPAIVLANDGTFSVKGTALPTGGYIPPNPFHAIFSGKVSGDTVALTVEVLPANGQTNGGSSDTYNLTAGVLAGPQGCI